MFHPYPPVYKPVLPQAEAAARAVTDLLLLLRSIEATGAERVALTENEGDNFLAAARACAAYLKYLSISFLD